MGNFQNHNAAPGNVLNWRVEASGVMDCVSFEPKGSQRHSQCAKTAFGSHHAPSFLLGMVKIASSCQWAGCYGNLHVRIITPVCSKPYTEPWSSITQSKCYTQLVLTVSSSESSPVAGLAGNSQLGGNSTGTSKLDCYNLAHFCSKNKYINKL